MYGVGVGGSASRSRVARDVAAWALAGSIAAIASCAAPVPTKPLALLHVTGTIRDRDGGGAAGVAIRAVASEYRTSYGPGIRTSDVTDSTGAFSLDLAEGTYRAELTAPASSGLPHVAFENLAFHPGRTRFDYRYTGYRVTGSVTAPDGTPVDSARVRVIAQGFAGASGFSLNGAFSLLVPSGGSYAFVVYPPFVSGIPIYDTDLITISADTTLAIAIPGDPVTGTVTDPDGAPLGGIRVSSGPASARTDASGGYRLWAVPGRYDFYIDPTSVAPRVLPRRQGPIEISGPTVLDFSLAGTRWSGTVRWSGSGEPVANARVYVRALTYYNDQSLELWTGSDGQYDFVLQTGLEYALLAEVPGGVGYLFNLAARADSTIDIPIESFAP